MKEEEELEVKSERWGGRCRVFKMRELEVKTIDLRDRKLGGDGGRFLSSKGEGVVWRLL